MAKEGVARTLSAVAGEVEAVYLALVWGAGMVVVLATVLKTVLEKVACLG